MTTSRPSTAAALAVFAIACATTAPLRAQDAPPMKHLVYNFTWGSTSNTEVHTSGMAGGGNASGMNDSQSASGLANYGNGVSDKGTITVDVLREQPDKGLVVVISEQAQGTRSAHPSKCVVFGDTTVVCDPNGKINAEELTLLRFLGATFVDPLKLDANRHWQVAQTSNDYTVTADYTISKNDDGKMTLSETRVAKELGAHPLTTDINATIAYDFTRTLPTSVQEYSIQRNEEGQSYTTIKTQTVLQLNSTQP